MLCREGNRQISLALAIPLKFDIGLNLSYIF